MNADPKESILKSVKKEGLIIPEEYQAVFMNHLNVLKQRLINGECLTVEDEPMKSQLRKESIDTAEKMLRPLLIEYGAPKNTSEVVLLAIYIDLAERSIKNG